MPLVSSQSFWKFFGIFIWYPENCHVWNLSSCFISCSLASRHFPRKYRLRKLLRCWYYRHNMSTNQWQQQYPAQRSPFHRITFWRALRLPFQGPSVEKGHAPPQRGGTLFASGIWRKSVAGKSDQSWGGGWGEGGDDKEISRVPTNDGAWRCVDNPLCWPDDRRLD